MKRLIAIAVLLASLGVGVGTTFAEDVTTRVPRPQVPIKGIEGPDIR